MVRPCLAGPEPRWVLAWLHPVACRFERAWLPLLLWGAACALDALPVSARGMYGRVRACTGIGEYVNGHVRTVRHSHHRSISCLGGTRPVRGWHEQAPVGSPAGIAEAPGLVPTACTRIDLPVPPSTGEGVSPMRHRRPRSPIASRRPLLQEAHLYPRASGPYSQVKVLTAAPCGLDSPCGCGPASSVSGCCTTAIIMGLPAPSTTPPPSQAPSSKLSSVNAIALTTASPSPDRRAPPSSQPRDPDPPSSHAGSRSQCPQCLLRRSPRTRRCSSPGP